MVRTMTQGGILDTTKTHLESGITAKVEMGGKKHAPNCCAILKVQVFH